ncbi:MAG: hypothetical protein IT269_09575 [Saprospiraceae bacterium]|nr:hypothetical protein [Saprospiraceae bacterium]
MQKLHCANVETYQLKSLKITTALLLQLGYVGTSLLLLPVRFHHLNIFGE